MDLNGTAILFKKKQNFFCHDPFDLWASPFLGGLKRKWYSGNKAAKILLYFFYGIDWLAPNLMRRVFCIKARQFPHSIALLQGTRYRIDYIEFVDRIEKMRVDFGWGLPFAWYSKNGIYPAKIPLITAAPYVLDALLKIPQDSSAKEKANLLFDESWAFMSSLKMHFDTEKFLALSYAPFDDEVTVINANSYAAWVYAMHAVYGNPERREKAHRKVIRLVNWIVSQQQRDGSWYYLCQRGDWDMIDGFHSCFVVRNLNYVQKLIPETKDIISDAIMRGWAYIRREFFDDRTGLCKRYKERHRSDPFKFDIYDQAEYLGLLIDFGHLGEAVSLANRVTERFYRNGGWFCRIDFLGRPWGRGFMRWGIIPFIVHHTRLERALAQERIRTKCVE